MTDKEINALIKKLWSSHTTVQIADRTGVNESTVRRRAKKLGLTEKSKMEKFHSIPEQGESDGGLKDALYKFLLKAKRGFTFEQLSDKYNCGISKIRTAIEELKKEHKNFHPDKNFVEISSHLTKSEPTQIDNKHLFGKRVKFGFVTDNHLGSNYERLDVLNALYERFRMEGITTVYNAGNVIDGEARFNKFDIHKYGMENQCKYFAEVYPKVEGITTYFITGDDHEGWYVQREGVNIGKFMETKARDIGRTDLVYLGHMEHDIIIKCGNSESIVRIVHPGGGSSYAYSYTSQKLVESYSPGDKPHILLMGHYHKASYNYIRGVYVLQGGCTMDQSPFMRKKRLEAHVGGWICEYQQGENGVIQSFQAEWIPFYGSDFYKNEHWEYKY